MTHLFSRIVIATAMVTLASTAAACGSSNASAQEDRSSSVTAPSHEPAGNQEAVNAAHTERTKQMALSTYKHMVKPDTKLPAPDQFTVGNTGYPVYTLNPQFVKNGGDAAQIGVFDYVGVVVTAPDKQGLTALVKKKDDKWRTAGVSSGTYEADYSTKKLNPGEKLLFDPRSNSWFAWTDKGVRLITSSGKIGRPGAFADPAQFHAMLTKK